MREDNPNWLARWEEELPPPEDLIPLSQTLISPPLALAFHIDKFPPPPTDYAGDLTEPARTLKRPRLVWTPQLHKRFVDAVAHLGIKNAVPKTIMQLMSVEGLTRENVASHLQKYRLYLRRMQGLSAGNGNAAGGGGGHAHVSDPATDHLFASSPVPAHFLSPPPGRAGSTEHFMASLMHHHRLQPPQQSRRQGNSLAPSTQSQLQLQFQRYEDLEPGNGDGGRKILTLFPTGRG